MERYRISLDRLKSHLAHFELDAESIFAAHQAGKYIKRQLLEKEGHFSNGDPKVFEDITVRVSLLVLREPCEPLSNSVPPEDVSQQSDSSLESS